jgi:hypothetical protein
MNTVAPNLHKLPPAGADREALRDKGQFWTPAWVADAMVAYALGGGSKEIFDPAVGAGVFLATAKQIGHEIRRNIRLHGIELDEAALGEIHKYGFSESDLINIHVRDFILDPPVQEYSAIVANPPYIRHHRLSAELKLRLRTLGQRLLGRAIDARAGLHVYFLLQSLSLLKKHGRLAFIVPADICEGVFAPMVWEWITRHYCLDGVVTFDAAATPFPGVDTNPIVFLLRNDAPAAHFRWLGVRKAGGQALRKTLETGVICGAEEIEEHWRELEEGMRTGFSRPPAANEETGIPLYELATVVRGIATGANDFFFLTQRHARELGLPPEFMIPAIGRTRDVEGDTVSASDLQRMEKKGSPNWLLSLGNIPIESLPSPLQDYLQLGMELGLHRKPLIATRRPWYRMESRLPPPFLFAYLGRRNTRFIRNLAGVVPLSGFLCVYPRRNDEEFIGCLWRALNHPKTIANLAKVGKSYGSGAIKVEPRSLERLMIPDEVLDTSGLGVAANQFALCEPAAEYEVAG